MSSRQMGLKEGVHSHLSSCIYRVGVAGGAGVGTRVEWSRRGVQVHEVREMSRSGGDDGIEILAYAFPADSSFGCGQRN